MLGKVLCPQYLNRTVTRGVFSLPKYGLMRFTPLMRRAVTYSSLAFGAGISSYLYMSPKWVICDDEDEDVFHLLVSLKKAAEDVDAKALLKGFLARLQKEGEKGTVIDLPFVLSLFQEVGIEDPEIAHSIFELMDYNRSGTLEPQEIAATFTLFQTGTDKERYKFLFHCLDLDRSGKVDKDEFRRLLTALLEARYHISGLHDPKDPDEWYQNMSVSDYHAIAKLKANMLVRTIFIFADQNRDGELNMKEFLHWCNRGGHEVMILKDLLSHMSTEGGNTYKW